MNPIANAFYQVEQIIPRFAEQLCREITKNLPEWFGLPECNEHYAAGVQERINFAVKINKKYIGLLSLDFPYPIIQNMARFYVYDMSRYCGFISEDWACPKDGLYESFDFKTYFEDPTRKAFLVYVEKELAGFVLLNQVGISKATEWNMGEFFILAKFQGKGIACQVAEQLWKTHPGHWK